MINCEFEDGGKTSLRHVVVDVIVTKDDRILLVKRSAKLLEGGKWALIGGFAERDETIAEAAIREVYEETGWEISDPVLLTIIDNPDRPNEDRQNVALIYIAKAIRQTGQPDWESDEIKWYSMDDLPDLDSLAFDHGKSIKLYKQYQTDKFALPKLK